MPKDAKRSLITWRCADCGRDLSTVDHIFVDSKGNAKCCCNGCAFDDDLPEPEGWLARLRRWWAL